jgi:hypothetical protein
MTDLLNHPAVQAAVIPFIVALVLAFALAGTRLLALAVVSGIAVVLALTIGFSLEPFTSVKKLIVAVFASAVIGVGLELARVGGRRAVAAATAGLAGLAALWVVQRVVQQMEPAAAWAAAIGAFALGVALTGSAIRGAATSSLRGAAIGACLGWGSGVLALIGASALLAQLGLAVGTASAAVALVQMIRGREAPLGWTLVVPAAVAATTIGVLASATGELRWYCLLPLPFAPLAARLVPAEALRRAWQQAVASGLAALVPVAVAVGLAWLSAASSSSAA